jgi:hypothetical protein
MTPIANILSTGYRNSKMFQIRTFLTGIPNGENTNILNTGDPFVFTKSKKKKLYKCIRVLFRNDLW